MLVGEKSRKITIRPIAGSRHGRGKTPAEDDAIAADLLADEKERAEHIMLVDLARNDIGRVAQYGTVSVDELMVIEKYSHVMHIVSEVTGTLRDELDQFDALRASFPHGTATGAPKSGRWRSLKSWSRPGAARMPAASATSHSAGRWICALTIRTAVVKDGHHLHPSLRRRRRQLRPRIRVPGNTRQDACFDPRRRMGRSRIGISRMPTILLTGFAPFGDSQSNPSQPIRRTPARRRSSAGRRSSA